MQFAGLRFPAIEDEDDVAQQPLPFVNPQPPLLWEGNIHSRFRHLDRFFPAVEDERKPQRGVFVFRRFVRIEARIVRG
jgi:hypothetical protein